MGLYRIYELSIPTLPRDRTLTNAMVNILKGRYVDAVSLYEVGERELQSTDRQTTTHSALTVYLSGVIWCLVLVILNSDN